MGNDACLFGWDWCCCYRLRIPWYCLLFLHRKWSELSSSQNYWARIGILSPQPPYTAGDVHRNVLTCVYARFDNSTFAQASPELVVVDH